MSLDNIQLPAILVHDLFKDSLIDLNTSQPAPGQPAAQPCFSFLGNNKQKITVVVQDKEALYLADNLLAFLVGILTACKLTMADIALVNLSQYPGLDHTAISDHTGAEKLILFGEGPEAIGLPMAFPHYQLQQYNGQVYLCGPELAILQADKAEKTKLWNSLKQLFGLT